MHELTALIETCQTLANNGDNVAIATVVKTNGSTYRRPGARFTLTSSGQTVGMVSGGCLEEAVRDRAQQVLESEEPLLVTYDGTAAEDIVWGLGLGCNGIVQVFIEWVDPQRSAYLAFIEDCLRQRQWGVLATVFAAQGDEPTAVGSRLMLTADGTVTSHIDAPALSAALAETARAVLAEERSRVMTLATDRGAVEALVEVIKPPTPLLIFGAGPDAVPLVQLAKALGWHVTVIDHRPAYAKRERFILADAIEVSRPEAVAECVTLDSHTVAVVMTHHYLTDQTLLHTLLPSPLRYLGVLGPRPRTERLLQELQQAGMELHDDNRQRLYAPVGLDIGAETPEEVALAIVAEIQAVLSRRSGISLRHRTGSIHRSH